MMSTNTYTGFSNAPKNRLGGHVMPNHLYYSPEAKLYRDIVATDHNLALIDVATGEKVEVNGWPEVYAFSKELTPVNPASAIDFLKRQAEFAQQRLLFTGQRFLETSSLLLKLKLSYPVQGIGARAA